MRRIPGFTLENVNEWIQTRDLPAGISLKCCLEEMRYLLIVNGRLREELAKQITTMPMLLDVQNATDDEGICGYCGKKGEIVRGL